MKTAIVIPTWNKKDLLESCLESLFKQSHTSTIIVVDNGSTDGTVEYMHDLGDKIVGLYNSTNLGFTGGVNPGMQYAIDHDYDAVALFNNDATADKDWMKKLSHSMRNDTGIATCSFRTSDGTHIDSTGDQFTTWGLPYPRDRNNEVTSSAKSGEEFGFGASGGASLYSVSMLKQIGLMDDDFFAYFEDTDLSFRAQLAGWKVVTNHDAIAYHGISATSSGMEGFSTYQSIKNWPFVIIKDVPRSLMSTILPRFCLAYTLFIGKAFLRGQGIYAIRGLWHSTRLWPKKLRERKTIQACRKVCDAYIWSILTHDLPENATNLRRLRRMWWKALGKV